MQVYDGQENIDSSYLSRTLDGSVRDFSTTSNDSMKNLTWPSIRKSMQFPKCVLWVENWLDFSPVAGWVLKRAWPVATLASLGLDATDRMEASTAASGARER